MLGGDSFTSGSDTWAWGCENNVFASPLASECKKFKQKLLQQLRFKCLHHLFVLTTRTAFTDRKHIICMFSPLFQILVKEGKSNHYGDSPLATNNRHLLLANNFIMKFVVKWETISSMLFTWTTKDWLNRSITKSVSVTKSWKDF